MTAAMRTKKRGRKIKAKRMQRGTQDEVESHAAMNEVMKKNKGKMRSVVSGLNINEEKEEPLEETTYKGRS